MFRNDVNDADRTELFSADMLYRVVMFTGQAVAGDGGQGKEGQTSAASCQEKQKGGQWVASSFSVHSTCPKNAFLVFLRLSCNALDRKRVRAVLLSKNWLWHVQARVSLVDGHNLISYPISP